VRFAEAQHLWSASHADGRIGETPSVFILSLGAGRHLRLPEELDAGELHELIASNRELLARWMPWAAQHTSGDTLAFIRSARQQLADNHGFQAVIVDGGAIAGVIGFSRFDWDNRSASLGYWLAETSQGHGIATDATRALISYAFGVWKLNRLEIRAGTENDRSQRVPERLGFVREGLIRDAERIGDRYVDHILYSVLARDWNP
jgi:ribosomal-protein-serine acetyltransferase